MTTITLEVPDELAAQFKIDPALLPEFVREAVAAKLTRLSQSSTRTASPQPIHQEVTDFLASSPTLEQIINFKISDPAQERLEGMLDKNCEAELTPKERVELDKYLQYRHVMILLKASARRVLNARPE